MSTIQLGQGGYRGRPEGWKGDLGKEKNDQLVKLGRATYLDKEEKPEEEKPKKRGKKQYKDKQLTPE